MRLPLFLTLITILLATFAAAEDITTAKQDYLLGETVQAEVNMQGFDISKLSFTDNKSSKTSVGFLTEKIGDRNFVYFNIPTNILAGEYYLIAKDKRVIDGVLGDFQIFANVTVLGEVGVSIDPAILSFDPAKNELKVSMKNNAAKAYSVSVMTSTADMKAARPVLDLAPGETKSAYVSYDLSKINSEQSIGLSYANRTYVVKVLLPDIKIIEQPLEQPVDKPVEKPVEQQVAELKFIGPDVVDKKASTYTSFSDVITVKSTSKDEIRNVKFPLTGTLAQIAQIKIQAIDKIPAEGSIEQSISINKDKKAAPGNYEGKIIVEADGGYKDEILFKITLEDLKLVEEKPMLTNVSYFNKSQLAALLNETKIREEPNVVQNVTIAAVLFAIVAVIGLLIGFRLRKRTEHKPLEEYVKGLKKGRK